MIRRPIRQAATNGAAQYRRGAGFERRLIADLRRRGYWTIRSGGSRGVADVVALAAGQQPLVIQAKRGGRLALPERLALVEVVGLTGAIGLLAAGTRDGWTYTNVITEEPWNGVALAEKGTH